MTDPIFDILDEAFIYGNMTAAQLMKIYTGERYWGVLQMHLSEEAWGMFLMHAEDSGIQERIRRYVNWRHPSL